MIRRTWGLTLLLLLVACSSSSSRTSEAALATCIFNLGDTVDRGGVGARVPELGGSVSGNADDFQGGSSSIQIHTSSTGVVTITSSKDGVNFPTESCQLVDPEHLESYQAKVNAVADDNIVMTFVDPSRNFVQVDIQHPDPELQKRLGELAPSGAIHVSCCYEVDFLGSSASPTGG